MSERIRGNYDVALYKSTYTLLYFLVYSAVRGSVKKYCGDENCSFVPVV